MVTKQIITQDTPNITRIQTKICFDENKPPVETCQQCNGKIGYYWAEQEYIYKRWGQKKPFWLRIGCLACDFPD